MKRDEVLFSTSSDLHFIFCIFFVLSCKPVELLALWPLMSWEISLKSFGHVLTMKVIFSILFSNKKIYH